MEIINQNSQRYLLAKKQLGVIYGFYVHLFVYIAVNFFIIVDNYDSDLSLFDTIFNWSTLGTAFFWGIGLFSHWSRVFGKNLLFSKNWEERKIQEFMSTKTSNK